MDVCADYYVKKWGGEGNKEIRSDETVVLHFFYTSAQMKRWSPYMN